MQNFTSIAVYLFRQRDIFIELIEIATESYSKCYQLGANTMFISIE